VHNRGHKSPYAAPLSTTQNCEIVKARKSRGSLGTVSADTAPCVTGHSARVSPLQDPLKMCNLRENLMTVPPAVVSGERRERERLPLREMRERMHRRFLHIDPGPVIPFLLLLLLLLLTRASLFPSSLSSSSPPPSPRKRFQVVASSAAGCSVPAASISVALLRNATS
jgi:hypothetical protein